MMLRYRLNIVLPPLPKVGCPIFLEIPNSWGKVLERNGLRIKKKKKITKKGRKIAAQFFSPPSNLGPIKHYICWCVKH